MLQYKAILFDLWDTLAEISNLEALTSDVKKVLGNQRYSKMMEHFVKWHTSNESQQAFITALDKDISLDQNEMPTIEKFIAPDNYKKFPETDKSLLALKNINLKLILVTNSPPSSKNAFQNLGLSKYFDKTVFSCDVGILKPSREIFMQAISGFGIDAQEALMVGNSLEKDVEGAIHSGLAGLLIDRKGLIEYKDRISSLSGLLDRMKK